MLSNKSMNTILVGSMKGGWFGRVFAVVIILSSSLSLSQGQNSPDGTWDFVLSGSQRGVAQITFLPDHTLSGTEIITAKRSGDSTNALSDNPRGGFGGGTRTPIGGGEASSDTTNFYGKADLVGTWTFDSALRVIGVIAESGGSMTNGISFKANVRPNRIMMTGLRNGRRITYSGVPVTSLPDFSGEYYGQGKLAGQPFTELFTIVPAGGLGNPELLPPGFMNGYDIVGLGPAYSTVGAVIISAQNQMALVTLSNENTNGVLRSVAGPFRLTRSTGSLKGISENGDGESNVSLKVTKSGATMD
jgi:hypothetical protein